MSLCSSLGMAQSTWSKLG